MSYTRAKTVLGAGSSGATSNPYFVGDHFNLTVSIQTSTTSASRFTVNGTNADGFQSALNTASASGNSGHWSIVTTITSAGVFTLDTGIRWLTVTRPDFMISAASTATVVIAGSF